MHLQSMRMENVQSPIIPIIAALIRDNPGTISLGQGIVHYGPPAAALSAIASFGQQTEHHVYQEVHGIPELVSAIAAKLTRENGIDTEKFNIVVTAGSNMGFLNAVLAITDPGDEIILLSPFYFNHEMAIRMTGCVPEIVAARSDFTPDLDAIEAAIGANTRAIVSISPNNPTGAVYGQKNLVALNDLCARHGLYHISDEAYEYFVYDDANHYSPASALSGQGHTISLFSLSKAYGFASWRIGYMLIPPHLFESVIKIQDTNLICPPVVCQYGAVGALESGRTYAEQYLPGLSRVRQLVKEELHSLGSCLTVSQGDGAFYFLIRFNRDLDAMEVATRLITHYRVAVIPGMAFGMNKGCYLRIAYGALQENTVKEGIKRLANGIRDIVKQAS